MKRPYVVSSIMGDSSDRRPGTSSYLARGHAAAAVARRLNASVTAAATDPSSLSAPAPTAGAARSHARPAFDADGRHAERTTTAAISSMTSTGEPSIPVRSTASSGGNQESRQVGTVPIIRDSQLASGCSEARGSIASAATPVAAASANAEATDRASQERLRMLLTLRRHHFIVEMLEELQAQAAEEEELAVALERSLREMDGGNGDGTATQSHAIGASSSSSACDGPSLALLEEILPQLTFSEARGFLVTESSGAHPADNSARCEEVSGSGGASDAGSSAGTSHVKSAKPSTKPAAGRQHAAAGAATIRPGQRAAGKEKASSSAPTAAAVKLKTRAAAALEKASSTTLAGGKGPHPAGSKDPPASGCVEKADGTPRTLKAIHGDDAGDDAALECAVCLAEFVDDEFVRVLPCVHLFHASCIDKWFSRATSCPTCKQPVALG